MCALGVKGSVGFSKSRVAEFVCLVMANSSPSLKVLSVLSVRQSQLFSLFLFLKLTRRLFKDMIYLFNNSLSYSDSHCSTSQVRLKTESLKKKITMLSKF